jgi:hypothetical protein
MRTTVTIDPDVERLLRDAAHRDQTSFKRVLNNAVRLALGSRFGNGSEREVFQVEPREMGLRRGIDPARLHDIDADLEAEAFLEATRRLEATDGKR